MYTEFFKKFECIKNCLRTYLNLKNALEVSLMSKLCVQNFLDFKLSKLYEKLMWMSTTLVIVYRIDYEDWNWPNFILNLL